MGDERRLAAIAWVLAGVSGILLFASARGSGTGLFDSGAMRHPGWTYAVFLAVVAIGLWVAIRAGPPAAPTTKPVLPESDQR